MSRIAAVKVAAVKAKNSKTALVIAYLAPTAVALATVIYVNKVIDNDKYED
jgi:hypothetical protein